jgi:hypothetical protein
MRQSERQQGFTLWQMVAIIVVQNVIKDSEMNQRTHAWIAIRAIKLLEDEGSVPDLLKLLKPFTQQAAIGAWLPDKRDAKLGSAGTQNHVFKIGLYDGNLKSRFVVKKDKMLMFLGETRLTSWVIIKYSNVLDDQWWSQSYKADPPPGMHLANRAMALSICNIDQLILGDKDVQAWLPGRIDFIDNIQESIKTTPGHSALFFFMLSHFIADSLMPCHCDERDLSDYDGGLHKELEAHWSKKIGNQFEEKELINSSLDNDQILKIASDVDSKFNIQFTNKVPIIESDDIWEEVVLLCRGSFALSSIIAPPSKYPYKPKTQVKTCFEDLFEKDQYGEDLLSDLDKVVMHDAVLNVAMVWKYIWKKFK